MFGSLARFNRFFETQRLHHGQQIRILWHIRRTKLIATVSAIVFVTLEIFVSFYSDPARVTETKRMPCISVDSVRNARSSFFKNDNARNVIGQCSFVLDGVFHQRGGNVTETGGELLVQCAEEDIFSVNIREQVVERQFPSIKPVMGCSSCSHTADVENCFRICAFAVRHNNSVFYSWAVELEEALAMNSSGMAQEILSYLETSVHFDSRNLLSTIAERAAEAFADIVSDPTSQRRRIFMGSREGTCEFSIDRGEGTNVPLALIISVACVWFISLILRIFSLFARTENMFDVSNPLDWAFRALPKDNAVIKSNSVIRWGHENGDRPYMVSEAVSETDL
ncbi:hypothetical protein FGB62_73g13 [Gracilaria domingensis]|nr:hypothetical protein FGB62_73g13 [Gracilaria domingensis]